MELNLNSWDYYDLEKEMQESNVANLLEMFKREDKKYSEKCQEYVKYMGKLSDNDKQEIQDECEFMRGSKLKIALRITEELTGLG